MGLMKIEVHRAVEILVKNNWILYDALDDLIDLE